MKNIKDLSITLLISAIVLIAGFALLENHFKSELKKMGWLPKTKINLYPYGRRISGYTVSENAPDYTFDAYNDKFQPATAQTDSNGFITGGHTLQKEKDSNTIRIFITGGSGAWGSIESREIMKDTTYPGGCYNYDASIAGKLAMILKARYPGLKFEVINAATVRHCFNQNFALYYEKLHDFNPDIVINIDGFNDKGNFIDFVKDADPYLNSMNQMGEELELAAMSRLPQWPNMLAYYNFKYVQAQGAFFEKRKNKFKKPALPANTVIDHSPGLETYEGIKMELKVSEKMLWLIASYERQLQADNVYSIFCLQPTLQRMVYQKQLSPLESKFRAHLNKITVADTLRGRDYFIQLSKSNPVYQTIQNKIGMDIYWLGVLKSAYLFNDLSPVLDSIVTSNGGAYVDINKTMTSLASDKEFYVDYCHLTPFGNEFVAQQLAEKVGDYLAKRH